MYGRDDSTSPQTNEEQQQRPVQPHQLAGPLCFAGDVYVRAFVL